MDKPVFLKFTRIHSNGKESPVYINARSIHGFSQIGKDVQIETTGGCYIVKESFDEVVGRLEKGLEGLNG